MKSKQVTAAIDELLEMAREEGDTNVQIILRAMRAARTTGDDSMLAAKIQEYIKDVLLPKAHRDKEQVNVQKN